MGHRIPVAVLGLFLLFPAAPPRAADLLWPSDPRALHAEASGAPLPASWPLPADSLCARALSGGPAEACASGRDRAARPLRLEVSLGARPSGHLRPFGRPFESFSPGWGSVRVDPEVARAWTDLPPLVALELNHAFSPGASLRFRVGLRRDLAAWREDDAGLNAPLASREVDLNEPSLGYFDWSGRWLGFTVGRFPIHWSPSPDFGLALSSAVPRHDGALATLRMSRVRYLFLVSSLNPWLQGTPAGSVSSEDYPEGSEEWRQRHYPDIGGSMNAHKRVYDARVKTLLAHRLELRAGPAVLGATESHVVGGKPPDLRDGNPFAVFHNDFHEGYSNNGVSLDARAALPLGFSLAAETFMDDLEWSDTEGESATPSLLGYLGGVRHAARVRGWSVIQSLTAVRTDPFLYGFLQPLATHASRQVITSNHDGKDGGVLVDKYVVDYPLGYLRGGDALDLWYRLEALRGRDVRISLLAGLLSRGPAGLAASYEEYYEAHGGSPTGTAEEELRFVAEGSRAFRGGWAAWAGARWSRIRNEGNVAGRDADRLRLDLGLTWSHPE